MITVPAPTESGEFRTARGRSATMLHRPGTADWNNVYSCLTEDEYGLKDLDLGDGTALDIGAHIGGVTVSLALDNPQAHIIAVEALSENVELLQRNVDANGVSDRVTVLHAIAGTPGKQGRKGTVRWNFDADETGQHHRYIANAKIFEGGQFEEADVVSLDDLGPVAFAKIDCEGCEYDVLSSPAVKDIAEIRGEHHAGFDRLSHLLTPTHDVYLTSGTEAFGGFRAVRK